MGDHATILTWLQDQMQHNQFFSGAAGISIVGGLVFWLRALPEKIWRKIKWAVTVSVIFTNDNRSFQQVLRWLAPRMASWNIREFRAIDLETEDGGSFSDSNNPVDWMLTIGYGDFWTFWRGRPFHVKYETSKEAAQTRDLRIRETITITAIGFTRRGLDAMLSEMRNDQLAVTTIPILLWRGYWRHIDRRRPRSPDTISLPDRMLDQIIADIEWFNNAREEYARVGTPYRRSYLFCGEPGTGKSSTVFVLASHFKLPLYVLNLASINGDDSLFDALAGVPPRALVLIEDIDAADSASARIEHPTKGAAPKSGNSDEVNDDESDGISLSGLLNAIDGVFAKEGRILFMTTNFPEKLDSALVRPGRVDKRWTFKAADVAQAEQIIGKFFPGVQFSLSGYNADMTPAEIQAACQNSGGILHSALAVLGVTQRAPILAASKDS